VTPALFISDLHLAAERPATSAQLFGFLDAQARGARALYILGDLFEYWIGDDDLADPFNASIARALAGIAARGTGVFLMHGNRDFLLGEAFCHAAGAALLEDPCLVRIAGEEVLLMHGDTLCTDDIDYQEWRRTARSEAWQRDFLSKRLEQRREAILGLRAKSKEVIAAKPAEIMDVNDGAVRAAFRRHGVRRLIHGHTHRAARHELEIDGMRRERWVLPDWYGPGGYLAFDAAGPRLVTF
jgi:UDP-2,3-diacylglucosamine hydrolase